MSLNGSLHILQIPPRVFPHGIRAGGNGTQTEIFRDCHQLAFIRIDIQSLADKILPLKHPAPVQVAGQVCKASFRDKALRVAEPVHSANVRSLPQGNIQFQRLPRLIVGLSTSLAPDHPCSV